MRKCTYCKRTKNHSEFYSDSSRAGGLSYRCKKCDAGLSAKRNSLKVKIGKGRPRLPIRDGDITQARTRIRVMVKAGEIPHPNKLNCFDCKKRPTLESKHEYDHYMGYGIEGHDKVQPVCRKCHRARERSRRVGV